MVTIPQGTSPKKIAVKLIKTYGKNKALQMATNYNIPVGVMNLVLSTPMGQDAVKDFNTMKSDLLGGLKSGLTSALKFNWKKPIKDKDKPWYEQDDIKFPLPGTKDIKFPLPVQEVPTWQGYTDFENPFVPKINTGKVKDTTKTIEPVVKPKVIKPTMRDVTGPVYKDTAQGQGQREERQQKQQKQSQIQKETAKYKDTATTGAKAGYTYGLQRGGKIKKVKSKYAKGGGVRTSKYKL